MTNISSAIGTIAIVIAIGAVTTSRLSSQPPASHTVTTADIERWKTEQSNWGRWGKDDQIGALNLITPAKRKQAAGLVKEGVSVSMAGDPDTVKFCHKIGLNYVSCSPFRVPIARLAAAQAAISGDKSEATRTA